MGREPLKYNTRALLRARVVKKSDSSLNYGTDFPTFLINITIEDIRYSESKRD